MTWLFRPYKLSGVVLRKPLMLLAAMLLMDAVPTLDCEADAEDVAAIYEMTRS